MIDLTFSKFSATVFPVTVKQSPCNKPSSNKYFITAGIPPYWCRSCIKNLPDGLKSAKTGVSSDMRWKSSGVMSTSTDFPIAIKCNTALVEPPRMTITRMAFSNALRVITSDGLMSFSRIMRMYLPTSRHSCFFSSDTAGFDDE